MKTDLLRVIGSVQRWAGGSAGCCTTVLFETLLRSGVNHVAPRTEEAEMLQACKEEFEKAYKEMGGAKADNGDNDIPLTGRFN